MNPDHLLNLHGDKYAEGILTFLWRVGREENSNVTELPCCEFPVGLAALGRFIFQHINTLLMETCIDQVERTYSNSSPFSPPPFAKLDFILTLEN